GNAEAKGDIASSLDAAHQLIVLLRSSHLLGQRQFLIQDTFSQIVVGGFPAVVFAAVVDGRRQRRTTEQQTDAGDPVPALIHACLRWARGRPSRACADDGHALVWGERDSCFGPSAALGLEANSMTASGSGNTARRLDTAYFLVVDEEPRLGARAAQREPSVARQFELGLLTAAQHDVALERRILSLERHSVCTSREWHASGERFLVDDLVIHAELGDFESSRDRQGTDQSVQIANLRFSHLALRAVEIACFEVSPQDFTRLHWMQESGVDLSDVRQDPGVRIQRVGLLARFEATSVVAFVAQLLAAFE